MQGIVAQFLKIVVGFNNTQLMKGIEESNKAINKFTRNMHALFKLAGFSFLTKMAIDAATLGRNLSIVSKQLGIASSRLSHMQSAFASVGIKADSISGVLTGISEGIAGLSFGEGEFASKLASMGISAWDGGKEKEADTILGDIAQWTKAQLDAGRDFKQVALLLKRNFNIQNDLALQLSKGRETFERLISERAEKTGSLYDFQVEGLNELSESFNTLWETIKVFKNQFVADISPLIKFFVDLFQYVAKTLGDIWNDFMVVWEDVVGETSLLSDTMGVLKSGINALAIAVKAFLLVIQVGATVFKEAFDVLFTAILWVVDGLKKAINQILSFFGIKKQTDEEKYREAVKEKVAKGEISATEGVKLIADYNNRKEIDKKEKEGVLTHEEANKERIEKKVGKQDALFEKVPKLTTKDLITGKEVYLDGTPVEEEIIIGKEVIEPDEYDFEQSIYPTGKEVMKADNSGTTPIVNLEVSTNATYNADGTIKQDIDINGVSKGSSGGQNIDYMYQSVTGE